MMAFIHASVPHVHQESMALHGDNLPDMTELRLNDSVFPLDSDFTGVEETPPTRKFKEPSHSILKSPHSDDLLEERPEKSDPVTVPDRGGVAESPSLSSLGTSPGSGSMAEMWRLWGDDVDDNNVTEFSMVVPPARRSLSLKAQKTPPGTPSPKKMVRFADAMGLDLEKVRHFMQDQLPNTSAAAGAAPPIATLTNELNRHTTGKYLTPAFPQPCLAGNFLERIRQQKVCLDSVQTLDFTVKGTVRVLNVAFEKGVVVRYTFDGWRNSLDTAAQYVLNGHDNFSDRFQFEIHAPSYLDLGEQLQFAICYKAGGVGGVGGEEFWDSNYGQNYCLTCCAGAGSGGFTPRFSAFINSPPTNAFL